MRANIVKLLALIFAATVRFACHGRSIEFPGLVAKSRNSAALVAKLSIFRYDYRNFAGLRYLGPISARIRCSN
jgi:hypothetical protein